MLNSFPQLIATVNLVGASLFVTSPTYFTPVQYDRPVLIAEAKEPEESPTPKKVVLGVATAVPTATPTATPSATPTPLPLVEEVAIPATMETPYGPITYT